MEKLTYRELQEKITCLEKELKEARSTIKFQREETEVIDGFSNILRLHADEDAKIIIAPIIYEGKVKINVSFRSDKVSLLQNAGTDLMGGFKALKNEIWYQRNQLDEIVDFLGCE